MDDLEGLMIYKQYLSLIYYTEDIVLKYPKSEKSGLVSIIKKITYNGMRNIILAQKERDRVRRVKILGEVDVDLKMIKVLVRVSNRRRYISYKNYDAWSRKITNIGNLLGGWIKSCVGQ